MSGGPALVSMAAGLSPALEDVGLVEGDQRVKPFKSSGFQSCHASFKAWSLLTHLTRSFDLLFLMTADKGSLPSGDLCSRAHLGTISSFYTQ